MTSPFVTLLAVLFEYQCERSNASLVFLTLPITLDTPGAS